MSQQCTQSSKFSNLENYKGFFPSYVGEQLDISTDFSTGDMSDPCTDLVEVKCDRSAVRLAENTTKETRRQLPELSEGHGSGSSSGSGGGSGGSGARGPGTGRPALRKAKTPRRGARRNDPRFRGVTFRVEPQICREKRHGSQLNIRSFYSTKKKLSRDQQEHAKTQRRKSSVLSSTSGSDEAETRGTQHIAIPYAGIVYGNKQCASCLTRRTPLWRDAEDGTPLCNACGIRYKKYRVRCIGCWNIPKKDGKSLCQVCSRCGDALRFTIPKRSICKYE